MTLTLIHQIAGIEAFRRYLYCSAFFLVYTTAYLTLAALAGSTAAGWLNLAVQAIAHSLIIVTAFALARQELGSPRLAWSMVGMGGILGFIVDIAYNYFVNILKINTNTDILDMLLYHIPFTLFLIAWIVALMCFLHSTFSKPSINIPAISIIFGALIAACTVIHVIFYSSIILITQMPALPRVFHIGFAFFELSIFILGLMTLSLARDNHVTLLVLGLLLLLCHDLIFQSEEITATKRPLDFLEISWTLALMIIFLGILEGLNSTIHKKDNLISSVRSKSDSAISIRGYLLAIVIPPLLISNVLFSLYLYHISDPAVGLIRERYIFFGIEIVLVCVVALGKMIERRLEWVLIDHRLDLYKVFTNDRADHKNSDKNIRPSYIAKVLGFDSAVKHLMAEWRRHNDRSIVIDTERIFVAAPALELESGKPLCFVLMPFTPSWSRPVYESIVKASVAADFDCLRADEIFGRDVIADIWRGITSASVIIADLSGRNANVLYEVGIGHTLGKRMILLAQASSDIPFDLTTRRVIIYKLEEIETKGFTDKIERMLWDIKRITANMNDKDLPAIVRH